METENQRIQRVASKHTAWDWAKEMVDPIVEKHELEQQGIGSIFAPTVRISKVDQHIEHILRVANWLLEP